MRRFGWVASRILGAALFTGLILFVASAALFFTTRSAALSLAVEPVSLLLMPGVFVSLVAAGSHDMSPDLILRTSAAFYFLLFCFLLLRRPRTHKPSR